VSDFQQHGQRQGAGEFSRLGLWYVITGDRKGQFRSWEVQGDQGLGWCAAWSRVPECAADGETEWLLLWDAMLGRPPLDRLGALVTGRGDVFHAGLGLGLAGLPKLLSLIWPTWMLGADADPAIESSSWRLSLRACLLRAEVLRQMGWLRGEFDSLEAAGLELGLRYLQGGVILRHTPALVPAREPRPTLPLPWLDEVRLAATAAGRKWAAYAVLRAWQKGWCPVDGNAAAFALLLSAAAHPEPRPQERWRERPDGAAQGATVSVSSHPGSAIHTWKRYWTSSAARRWCRTRYRGGPDSEGEATAGSPGSLSRPFPWCGLNKMNQGSARPATKGCATPAASGSSSSMTMWKCQKTLSSNT
jgi:hypothetical protein